MAAANGGQHDAADFKRSVYFTDEVKIRIEGVSEMYLIGVVFVLLLTI